MRLLPSRFGRDPTAAAQWREHRAPHCCCVCTVRPPIVWAELACGQTSYTGRSGTRTIGLSFGDLHAELTVKHLVNDGLMAFFFFIVGLEVKSQFTIGELTDRARAAVPVHRRGRRTDPARDRLPVVQPQRRRRTCLGCGDLHRHRVPGRRTGDHRAEVPARLRTFLLTLAVVDDVGALLAIALFYSDTYAWCRC